MLILHGDRDIVPAAVFISSSDMLKFEILTAVTMKNTVFWDATPCNLIEVYRRFVGTYCLHLQGRGISRARKQASSARITVRPWRWRHVPEDSILNIVYFFQNSFQMPRRKFWYRNSVIKALKAVRKKKWTICKLVKLSAALRKFCIQFVYVTLLSCYFCTQLQIRTYMSFYCLVAFSFFIIKKKLLLGTIFGTIFFQFVKNDSFWKVPFCRSKV
jgi:hypothetical protein